jgi:O-antigen biosynthesis protein WbqP
MLGQSNLSFEIRLIDFIFSFLGLILAFPVLIILIVVGFMDSGSPIFQQNRVGIKKKPYVLYKFRTMNPNTSSVATHLADVSAITPFGHFLRKTKLDELPQLWNVLKGEMSLVGPRPCLYNQVELIQEREMRGVFDVRPGITGLAQVNAIDMSTPKLLAETDAHMIQTFSLKHYFWYIFLTVVGKGSGDRVK